MTRSYIIKSTATVGCSQGITYNDAFRTPYVEVVHDGGNDYNDILNRRFNSACDALVSQIEEIKGLNRDLTSQEKTAIILSLHALLELSSLVRLEK